MHRDLLVKISPRLIYTEWFKDFWIYRHHKTKYLQVIKEYTNVYILGYVVILRSLTDCGMYYQFALSANLHVPVLIWLGNSIHNVKLNRLFLDFANAILLFHKWNTL